MENKINIYLFIIYAIIFNNLSATTIALDQNKPSIINQTIEKNSEIIVSDIEGLTLKVFNPDNDDKI